MIVCRFRIRKSADPEEFEQAIDALLRRAMKAGPTRVGQLDAFRLLRGDVTGSESAYQLELAGLMLLPAGLVEEIKSAGAGAITTSNYAEVLARKARRT